MVPTSMLHRTHPYLEAERRYIAGEIPSCQAIAMVLADREFLAEATLGSEHSPETLAQVIVTEQWAARLAKASARGVQT